MDVRDQVLADVACEAFRQSRKCREQRLFIPWFLETINGLDDKIAQAEKDAKDAAPVEKPKEEKKKKGSKKGKS